MDGKITGMISYQMGKGIRERDINFKRDSKKSKHSWGGM
jgi:hypothetical protein